jgi:hypothetical protein
MGAHGAIQWPARSPDLKRVKKKDSASMSGETPKFFTECKGGHF